MTRETVELAVGILRELLEERRGAGVSELPGARRVLAARSQRIRSSGCLRFGVLDLAVPGHHPGSARSKTRDPGRTPSLARSSSATCDSLLQADFVRIISARASHDTCKPCTSTSISGKRSRSATIVRLS